MFETKYKIDKNEFNELSKICSLDKKSVLSFIFENEVLISDLLHISKIILNLYGIDSNLNIKVVKDIEEGDETLFIYIEHNLSNEDALNMYFQFLDTHVSLIHPLLNVSPIYK